MRSIREMLRTHPTCCSIDTSVILNCLEACHHCELSCTICADACLAEIEIDSLRRCIRLNLDCADICASAARLLTRQTHMELSIVGEQLRALAHACRTCADECERHAQMHEHCRICAETCRRCEEACQPVLQALHVEA